MRLRTGRHQDRTLYIQMGDEPSDDDDYLCVFFDPARTSLFVDIVNGDRPPLPQPDADGRYPWMTAP